MIKKEAFEKRGWTVVKENKHNFYMENGNYFLIMYYFNRVCIVEAMVKDPVLEEKRGIPNTEFLRIVTRVKKTSQITNLNRLLGL